MPTVEFPYQTIETLTFSPKAQPLPASLRPVYRIALIVLVLRTNSHGNAASMLKLQFFNWLLKSSSLQELIETSLRDQRIFTLELIHLDPMVNLALKYAFADELISVTHTAKYKLTEKGVQFTERILGDPDGILARERQLLTRIGRQVSEVRLRSSLR